MLQKKIEVSHGELFDKLSILVIKSEKIEDEEKLRNVNYELAMLDEVIGSWSDWHVKTVDFYQKLEAVNRKLWNVEDEIRFLDSAVFHSSCPEKLKMEYMRLARSVYILNDQRAELKKHINIVNKSAIVEEKSYNKE